MRNHQTLQGALHFLAHPSLMAVCEHWVPVLGKPSIADQPSLSLVTKPNGSMRHAHLASLPTSVTTPGKGQGSWSIRILLETSRHHWALIGFPFQVTSKWCPTSILDSCQLGLTASGSSCGGENPNTELHHSRVWTWASHLNVSRLSFVGSLLLAMILGQKEVLLDLEVDVPQLAFT